MLCWKTLTTRCFILLTPRLIPRSGRFRSLSFIAKDVINIVPLLAVVLWLWGPRDRVCAQRQLIVKIGIALIISLAVSWTMGHLFPHDRPFVDHIGYNFLHHAADDSFPQPITVR